MPSQKLRCRLGVLKALVADVQDHHASISTDEREALREQAETLMRLLTAPDKPDDEKMAHDPVVGDSTLAACWPTDVPSDILAQICRFLSHKETLIALPQTSHQLHSSTRNVDFVLMLRAHAEASHLALPPHFPTSASSYLPGCVSFTLDTRRSWAVTQHGPGSGGALATAMAHYLAAPSLDLSSGQERCPLTVHTGVAHPTLSLYGDLPEGLVERQGCMESFQYDAGPAPATKALQVFRRGARSIGTGFGLRTLERIGKGEFACTYWGVYHEDRRRVDDTYVLFGLDRRGYGAGIAAREIPPIGGALAPVSEDEESDESDDECPLCGGQREMDYDDDDGSFCIDSTSRGNMGRWINHSYEQPNLAPRFDHSAGPVLNGRRMPLIKFFAQRDIEPGEELLWSYMHTRGGRRGPAAWKSLPGMGGSVNGHADEMLRTATDHTPVRATWFVDRSIEADQDSKELLLIEGQQLQGDSPFHGISMQHLHENAFLENVPPLPTEPWEPPREPDDDDEEFDPQGVEGFDYWPLLTHFP
jgi:hypothetical protein